MAKSRFEYVKEFETSCTILRNCWIVVRIDKRSIKPEATRTNQINDVELMSFVALKVMKSFQEIIFAFGHQNEYSFVFHRNTNLYNRRASKIASSVNSLFTAIYTSQWPIWFSNHQQLDIPIYCSSTYVFPLDENIKKYFLWRQTFITAVSNQEFKNKKELADLEQRNVNQRPIGTTLMRKIVKFTSQSKSRTYIIPFAVDFNRENVWQMHTELLSHGKPELFQLFEVISTQLLNKFENVKHGKHATDLDLYEFWLEYQDMIDEEYKCERLKTPLLNTNDNAINLNEFEVEDVIKPNEWIVIRIDGKGFHKFSEKHKFVKPNDADALNLMNFAAIKVMSLISDIVISYGQSDEYSFVFNKTSNFCNRHASKLESCVNSIFTANYIKYWKIWNRERSLVMLPTFDARTIPYASDSILKDYLSWRQADVHINNLYNTCFWKLVIDGNMKNSDAEEYLRIHGTYSADKRKLLTSKFGINYDCLPEMYKKGTILLWKYIRFGTVRRKIVIPYYTDLIGEAFWQNHSDIIDNLRTLEVGFDAKNIPRLCSEQLSASDDDEISRKFCEISLNCDDGNITGIRGLLCKNDEIDKIHSIVPNCWLIIKICGKRFKSFAALHNFEKPNDENGLNLMSHSAIQLMNEFKEIVLAYGHSDEYIFVINNASLLYRHSATELASTFNKFFTKYYIAQWSTWFPHQTLLATPKFETNIAQNATIDDLKDRLGREQKDAHEKNLYNTILWKLIVNGGRQLNDAEMELKNTTIANKNELLFHEFGINYNNMPIQHKKGTILLRSNLVIENRDRPIIVPHFKDIDSKRFWQEHDNIFKNKCCNIENTDDLMAHKLLNIQISATYST